MRSASRWIVDSVGSPAGTITHTVRGAWSLATRSSSEDAPVAPFSSAALTASGEKSNATTSWSESRSIRWDMLPPIFPRPMKPICMGSVPFDSGGDAVDAARQVVGVQADAHGGPAVVAQGLQVAVGLGGDQGPEPVGLARDLGVLAAVVDELQEAAGRRAALVVLPGRVQEARAVAPRRRDLRAPGDGGAQAGDRLVDGVLVGQVAHDRHVVGRGEPVEQLRAVALVHGLLTRLQRLARVALGLLDVGLVERVDLERPAGHGGGDLAEEEQPAEVAGAVRVDGDRRVAAVGQRRYALLVARVRRVGVAEVPERPFGAI